MNVPNALTLSRIFLVPILLTVLLTNDKSLPHKTVIAVTIVLIAAATDWVDGYLARRLQQVSTLGMLLDPVADKLLVSSVLISMVATGQVPAWMVVIIIGREFAVTGLRSIAQAAGTTIAASDLGKTKMVMQIVAIVSLLISPHLNLAWWIAQISLYIVVIFALISAVDYFAKFWKTLDAEVKQRKSRLGLLRTARRQRLKGGATAL
jgi:CDP-diacylglycerol--glycerol-3-phosphate 3-phosphatidyltransferase